MLISAFTNIRKINMLIFDIVIISVLSNYTHCCVYICYVKNNGLTLALEYNNHLVLKTSDTCYLL